MDYNKIIAIHDFLESKNQSVGSNFKIKLEINDYAKHWVNIDTSLVVENLIGVSDYRLTFMDDIILHYLGHVQMGVNFLNNVRFDCGYLYFTTSDGKKVRIS